MIKKEQLKGISVDKVSNKEIALIETKEKGGFTKNVQVSVETYNLLENYYLANNIKIFKVKYQAYVNDIKNSCDDLNLEYHSSHGYRWSFAQNRIREYQMYDFSYEQALQGVSSEMKHHRSDITEYYLGG